LLEERLPELGPGSPNSRVDPILRELTAELLFHPLTIRDQEMARCCLSALWLHHDYLDESHQICQDIDTPTGSCWHAIMHRREPDAGNSKHWWRRVGRHSFLGVLRKESSAVGYSFDSPESFVDFCERARGTGTNDELVARRVQLLEWQILFDWCWRQSL
jgi:hypothetical protein